MKKIADQIHAGMQKISRDIESAQFLQHEISTEKEYFHVKNKKSYEFNPNAFGTEETSGRENRLYLALAAGYSHSDPVPDLFITRMRLIHPS